MISNFNSNEIYDYICHFLKSLVVSKIEISKNHEDNTFSVYYDKQKIAYIRRITSFELVFLPLNKVNPEHPASGSFKYGCTLAINNLKNNISFYLIERDSLLNYCTEFNDFLKRELNILNFFSSISKIVLDYEKVYA